MPPTTRSLSGGKRTHREVFEERARDRILERIDRERKRRKILVVEKADIDTDDEDVGSQSTDSTKKNSKTFQSKQRISIFRTPSVRHASMKASMILKNSLTKVTKNSNNLLLTTKEATNSKSINDLPKNVLIRILSPLGKSALNELVLLRRTCRRFNAAIITIGRAVSMLCLNLTTAEEIREKGLKCLVEQIPPRIGWEHSSVSTVIIAQEHLNGLMTRELYMLFLNVKLVRLFIDGKVDRFWRKEQRSITVVDEDEDQNANYKKGDDESDDQQENQDDDSLVPSAKVEVQPGSETTDISNSSTPKQSQHKNSKKLIVRRASSIRHASVKASLQLTNSSSSKVSKNCSKENKNKSQAATPSPLNINDLPTEILFHIFSFLKQPGAMNGLVPHRRTCSRWNDVILAMCRSIRVFRLRFLSLDELQQLRKNLLPPFTTREQFLGSLLAEMPSAKRLEETLLVPRCSNFIAFIRLFHSIRPLLTGARMMELHVKGGALSKQISLDNFGMNIFVILFEHACNFIE